MNKRRTPQQWKRIYEEQRASSLTIAAFCRQKNIPTSNSYKHREKLQPSDNTSASFVKAKVTQSETTALIEHQASVISLENSAVKLTLPPNISTGYLVTLINGLSA
jgi:hypothetical protein